jgi:hypothetical protein
LPDTDWSIPGADNLNSADERWTFAEGVGMPPVPLSADRHVLRWATRNIDVLYLAIGIHQLPMSTWPQLAEHLPQDPNWPIFDVTINDFACQTPRFQFECLMSLLLSTTPFYRWYPSSVFDWPYLDYNTWEGQRAVAETVANSEHGSIQTPESQSSLAEPWPGKPKRRLVFAVLGMLLSVLWDGEQSDNT